MILWPEDRTKGAMIRIMHLVQRLSLATLMATLIILGSPATAHEDEASFLVRDVVESEIHLKGSGLDGPWALGTAGGPEGAPLGIGAELVVGPITEERIQILADNYGLTLEENPFEGVYVLKAATPRESLAAAAAIAALPEGLNACPILKQPLARYNSYAPPPSDPYFGEQVHLENRSSRGVSSGFDLNVRAAWPFGRGQGVSIGVGDEGVETGHPDLEAPTARQPHYDFILEESHLTSVPPVNGFHGTAVAGLAGARGDNDIGISGVAPESSIASFIVLGPENANPFDEIPDFPSSRSLARMYEYQNSRVQVQNHSWGSGTANLSHPGLLVAAAIESGATRGRGGRGVILVRAAGNSRRPETSGHPGMGNVNDEFHTNNPFSIAVAAVNREGRATSYSTPGAMVLVGAPSGDSSDGTPSLITTDLSGSAGGNIGSSNDPRSDYIFDRSSGINASTPLAGFSGTSAAAPQVAGLAAIALSINSRLTYRDIQQLLVLSSRQVGDDARTQINGGGFAVNENIGFGVPDAGALAYYASEFTPRPEPTEREFRQVVSETLEPREFRIEFSGIELPGENNAIAGLPGLGVLAPLPTESFELAYVGLASNPIDIDLSGRIALIQRGVSLFRDKIQNAANAGAVAAIIFNNLGDDFVSMAETDYAPIPAVFIGQSSGQALRFAIDSGSPVRGQFAPERHEVEFRVRDPMLIEHVGVEIRTTIQNRSRLLVNLISPSGTVSELHRANNDQSHIQNWTFWSAQHFFEPSQGRWRVSFTNLGDASQTGEIQEVRLTLRGVDIEDEDNDGLDDGWETRMLGGLEWDALADPDNDGLHNMMEQVIGLDPARRSIEPRVTLSTWNEDRLRIGWPGIEGRQYALETANSALGPYERDDVIQGTFPFTETIVPLRLSTSRFYRVVELPAE